MNASLYSHTLSQFLEPIQSLLMDDSVSEILINGCEEIYAERKGRLALSPHTFRDELELMAAARHLAGYVGRSLDALNPILEGRMPDGSRIQIVLPPLSRKGIAIAIRRFSRDILSLGALIQTGSLTQAAADLLAASVHLGKNILVAGGTGTGKTSLLNVLTGMMPEGERLVVIEDAAELQPRQKHVLSLETRTADREGKGGVDIRELFRAALRLRPDRILIGEMRGKEAMDVIQAMASGHHGSMSTLHASSPYDALMRLETLALMSDIAVPLQVLRQQIASAIAMIVQMGRLRDGSRRVITIAEVCGLDAQQCYQIQPLFQLKPVPSDTVPSGMVLQPEEAPSYLQDIQRWDAKLRRRLPW